MKATFLWFALPAFSGNPVKRVSQRPKGYLADTGLSCHPPRTTRGERGGICAVEKPRWLTEEVMAITWNLL